MSIMRGIALTFTQRVESGGFDDFNNPIFTDQTFTIEDCLVAPVTEPQDRIESAALERDQTIVRIHLPKADDRDVSDSTMVYDGQTFRLIGKPVRFMTENTPTRWNRYMRAEVVNG